MNEPNDLASRMIALSAAGRYCERNYIDPDDEALRHWHEGRMSEHLLLHWKAENPIRAKSRIIAVKVAAAVWQINRVEGKLDVSPLFNAFSEVLSEWVTDLIADEEFDQRTAAIVPVPVP